MMKWVVVVLVAVALLLTDAAHGVSHAPLRCDPGTAAAQLKIIGCNKGLTSSEWFHMWVPELGINKVSLRNVMVAQHLARGGNPAVTLCHTCDTTKTADGRVVPTKACTEVQHDLGFMAHGLGDLSPGSTGQPRHLTVHCIEPSDINFLRLDEVRQVLMHHAAYRPGVKFGGPLTHTTSGGVGATWLMHNVAMSNVTGEAAFSKACSTTLCQLEEEVVTQGAGTAAGTAPATPLAGVAGATAPAPTPLHRRTVLTTGLSQAGPLHRPLPSDSPLQQQSSKVHGYLASPHQELNPGGRKRPSSSSSSRDGQGVKVRGGKAGRGGKIHRRQAQGEAGSQAVGGSPAGPGAVMFSPTPSPVEDATYKVKVWTVDKLMQDVVGANTSVLLLKIDTEGWDGLVLQGASGALERKVSLTQPDLTLVDFIIFEYNSVGKWRTTLLADVVTWMEQKGYACYFDSQPDIFKLSAGCWLPGYEVHQWSNVNFEDSSAVQCSARKESGIVNYLLIASHACAVKARYFSTQWCLCELSGGDGFLYGNVISLFGTVFDPLHVILPPFGSTSHSGVASRLGPLLSIVLHCLDDLISFAMSFFICPYACRNRRDELVAGGISVPSSLCCRRTGNSRLLPRQAWGVVSECVLHTMLTHATKSADLHRCLAVLRINTKPTPAQGSPKQQCRGLALGQLDGDMSSLCPTFGAVQQGNQPLKTVSKRWPSPAQPSPAQPSPAQPSPAQPSPAQPSLA
ncbi:hypothetical protein QJQ45_015021 [Haematococcus lacustris]|nr:hypothetical protein QJQ45_015021 [Haematococcus lacustris]